MTDKEAKWCCANFSNYQISSSPSNLELKFRFCLLSTDIFVTANINFITCKIYNLKLMTLEYNDTKIQSRFPIQPRFIDAGHNIINIWYNSEFVKIISIHSVQ